MTDLQTLVWLRLRKACREVGGPVTPATVEGFFPPGSKAKISDIRRTLVALQKKGLAAREEGEVERYFARIDHC